jgi:hypothetical protein
MDSHRAAELNRHEPTREGTARHFAELLYRFRLAAGLSRMEVAERVLCSENYLYRLESRDPRHRRVPTPWIVRSLADALSLSSEDLERLLRARDRFERDITRRPATAITRE